MKYTCLNCGYTKENEETDFTCPICSGLMKEDINTTELIDRVIVSSLAHSIKQAGNDRVYRIIEGFSRAEMRLRYRKYFFRAGGSLPK